MQNKCEVEGIKVSWYHNQYRRTVEEEYRRIFYRIRSKGVFFINKG